MHIEAGLQIQAQSPSIRLMGQHPHIDRSQLVMSPSGLDTRYSVGRCRVVKSFNKELWDNKQIIRK